MNKVILPIFDKKKIYGGNLLNNIKYILMHVDNLNRSYVSISIKTGSYNDPEEYEGLSHFLEHMLFLGSKKYPNENYFSDKINEYNGLTNAFTSNFNTTYYFNINNKGLLEVLDIFSRFFIDPLFNELMIDKEINAVNNEYLKNINDDAWKLEQLIHDISNKKNFFSVGSSKTLNKPNIKKELIKYYNDYYNSDNISICIASSLSIDELYNIILKTFGIIDKKISKKTNVIKPLLNNNILKTYQLISITDIYNLIYIWEIPSINNFYYQDFFILENILLELSNDSLYFNLVKKGLINNMDVSIYNEEGIFMIIFYTTKYGFKNQNIIEEELFTYINYIYNLNLHEYGLYYENINNNKFKYLNNLDITMLSNILSKNHSNYETKDVYSAIFNHFSINTTEYYCKLYKKYINNLNCIKIIQTNEYILDKSKYIKSKYFDNKYCIIDNKTNFNFNITKINNYNISNKYIDFYPIIINNLNEYESPSLINNNQWYGCISKFNEPIIKIWIKLNDYKKFNSPKNYILSQISSTIINLLISTIFFKELKNFFSFYFVFSPINASYYIIIESFNDINYLKIILKKIYSIFTNFEEVFSKYLSKNIIKHKINHYITFYNNINFFNPWEYEEYIFNINTYNYYYTIESLIKELTNINYDEILYFIKNIIYNNIITSFIYGNIDVEKVNLLNQFHLLNIQTLNYHYISSHINFFDNIICKHPNTNEKSKCIAYYYKIGNFNPKINLLLLLVMNIYNTLFYNILRTKYQLGYLVQMNYKRIKKYYLIYQKIQFESDNIKDIEIKIDEFNNNLIKHLDSIDINNYITILKDQLKEKEYSVEQIYNKYMIEINNQEYLFNKNKLILKYINKINKNDIIDFINTYINKNNRMSIIIN